MFHFYERGYEKKTHHSETIPSSNLNIKLYIVKVEGCRIFDRFRCALQGSSYLPALLTISAWRWMKPRHTSLSCRISEVNSSCELQMKEWVVTLWSMNIKSYTWIYNIPKHIHLYLNTYDILRNKCCGNICVNISNIALRLYTLQTSPSLAWIDGVFIPFYRHPSIPSMFCGKYLAMVGLLKLHRKVIYFKHATCLLKRSKKSQNNLKLKQEN